MPIREQLHTVACPTFTAAVCFCPFSPCSPRVNLFFFFILLVHPTGICFLHLFSPTFFFSFSTASHGNGSGAFLHSFFQGLYGFDTYKFSSFLSRPIDKHLLCQAQDVQMGDPVSPIWTNHLGLVPWCCIFLHSSPVTSLAVFVLHLEEILRRFSGKKGLGLENLGIEDIRDHFGHGLGEHALCGLFGFLIFVHSAPSFHFVFPFCFLF